MHSCLFKSVVKTYMSGRLIFKVIVHKLFNRSNEAWNYWLFSLWITSLLKWKKIAKKHHNIPELKATFSNHLVKLFCLKNGPNPKDTHLCIIYLLKSDKSCRSSHLRNRSQKSFATFAYKLFKLLKKPVSINRLISVNQLIVSALDTIIYSTPMSPPASCSLQTLGSFISLTHHHLQS